MTFDSVSSSNSAQADQPAIPVHAARWVDRHIRLGEKAMYAQTEDVTPDIARALLGSNPENRNISPDRVRRMAEDMKNGRWLVNGETIIVSEEGYLNDGQHRLSALIEAGVTLPLTIVWGVTRESRMTVDSDAAVRTTGDILHMVYGTASPNGVAAVASSVMSIEQHGFAVQGGKGRISKAAIIARCREDAGIAEAFYKVGYCKKARQLGSLTVVGTMNYFMRQIDESLAEAFWDAVIGGEGLRSSDPRYVLREKLLDKTLRLRKNEQLKVIASAWNAWRAGKTIVRLQHSMKRAERLPELV